MVETDGKGAVIKVEGSFSEIAGDICTLINTVTKMIVNGELKGNFGEKINLLPYYEAILMTVYQTIGDEEAKKAMVTACGLFIMATYKDVVEEEGEGEEITS